MNTPLVSIETAGAIAPEVLFKDALSELRTKAAVLLSELDRDQSSE